VAAGAADSVAVGRMVIANPDLVDAGPFLSAA
jgi:2,4-dienoyl-CoA reductase-like NADH-dependent reductase (Old Yellow Enzyme family)